ncbi:MAG TPA: hypothetical protein VGX48_09700 [Pyrinomonadaceae bacterium]|jgi:hypothetical protein|nr:hypothetical protein [Pyrinomonadaceae bacterium]
MGAWGEDVENAYEKWAGAAEAESFRRDRRCAHTARGAEPARAYPGEVYLRALQSLKGSDAARAARNVEPFFWADAKVVRVWLCGECAAPLGLD